MVKADAVVPSAGVGSRMGAPCPKQYLFLGGKRILERTVEALLSCECVASVIIVISKEDPYFKDCHFSAPSRIKIAFGGRERKDSVREGLKLVTTDWVMVHDAARPFVKASDIEYLAEVCEGSGLPGILSSKVADTIKEAAVELPADVPNDCKAVAATRDRSRLYRAQTPQLAQTRELIAALDKAKELGKTVTDEASALEMSGRSVILVPGSEDNFKITTPADLKLARALTHFEEGNTMRIGHGFDVHRFGGDGPCTLGGVKVPYEQGLVAHSDGDVVIHAVCDALLGALALGDIGRLYPDNDDAFLGIDSRVLLRDVKKRIADLGYVVGNLDVTILAQAPKIAPHSLKMRENIAGDLEVNLDQVSIKATTTEKLGFTGRKEGIAVEAVALLIKRGD